jgi:hypothetical protein
MPGVSVLTVAVWVFLGKDKEVEYSALPKGLG